MQSNAKSIVDMAEGSTNAIREHAERLDTLKDRANKQFREALANELGQYQKALKHPKWQKKRLKVFERDKWMCKKCKSKTKTLHVHHLAYTKRYPWNELMTNLITLCEDCHKRKHGK